MDTHKKTTRRAEEEPDTSTDAVFSFLHSGKSPNAVSPEYMPGSSYSENERVTLSQYGNLLLTLIP